MKVHLTYHAEKTKTTFRGEVVEVKAFQIIVWMTISSTKVTGGSHRFPAILDIGNNHNFVITNEHLNKWTGIEADSLPQIGRAQINGLRATLHRASLWLHTDDDPYRMELKEGIGVLDGDWPRLPILGLRALTNSKLQTFIYGDTRQVLIRTPPPWYWPF